MLINGDDRELALEPALIEGDTGRVWTYAQLRGAVETLAARLPRQRSLIFCFCRNDLSSVVAYLACLRGGHPVAMLDAGSSPDLKLRLVQRYSPDVILESTLAASSTAWQEPYSHEDAPTKVSLWRRIPAEVELHPQLSLLLSTSGTTGSPKFVRLSRRNVESNAESIALYLGLRPGERAISSLPLHYTYGLSVLNSHLSAGGCVVLTDDSFIRPEFWKTLSRYGCTSLAGVPYSYQILSRIGFEGFTLPTLRTMTQAGGRMDEGNIIKYDALMKARGGRLFVMYGQTEATARIAYLPPDRLPEKAGSIGVAVPGGRLSIELDGAVLAGPGQTGEIVYRGPNVMLGYAESPEDLAMGDQLRGTLFTGDLGHLDFDGLLYLTGRRNRIAKIYGLRISLDEVERRLRGRGPVAVSGTDERIVVFCESGEAPDHEVWRQELAGLYRININAFEFRKIPALPLHPSGKIDYGRLSP
jgi:acyl-CoA synthetase (AMP-forming)/AMP-acid ligase II